MISPTSLDFWVAKELAGFLRHSPRFDEVIQSGIRHNIFGGFWYGAALFLTWCEAARTDNREVRLRLLTVLVGSTLAAALTIPAAWLVSWPPPIRHPELQQLFPGYIDANPNHNCFPSQSVALYASIALGMFSLNRLVGGVLGVATIFLVALPRMYVGGHYLSDVGAGLIIALIGYAVARRFLEPTLASAVEPLFKRAGLARIIAEFLIFVWILQVTVEFREVSWAKRALEVLLR
jgi:undecaprenyl-diphosphatase